MAMSILRLGLQGGRLSSRATRLLPAVVMTESRAGLTRKSMREPKHVTPFPYEKKKFNSWQAFLDDTEQRLDENSRIIVVEGNLCAGKTTVAKKIAEEFDFLHFPEVNMDMQFIDDDGFDIRSIEDKFPESLRPFDEKKFYAQPDNKMVPNFRYELFFTRIEQYCDAMAHLLNTGQGVVLERSVYSDFVFMNSLFKCGYVSKYDLDIYNEMKLNISTDFFMPHVVIYLDVPVDVAQKRIMSRGVPAEVNSKIRWADYLKGIEEQYKTEYLPSLEDKVELMIYDWSKFGDPEIVVEDLERLNIEGPMNDRYDSKFKQWKQLSTREWADMRWTVTSNKLYLVTKASLVMRYNMPQMIAGSEDTDAYLDAYDEHYPVESFVDPKKVGWKYLFSRVNQNVRDNDRHSYRTR